MHETYFSQQTTRTIKEQTSNPKKRSTTIALVNTTTSSITERVYLRFGRGVNDPIYAHQPKKDNSTYFNLQNELNYTRLYHLQNVTHHFSLQIFARTHTHPVKIGCHPRRARSSAQPASKIQRHPAHRMAGAGHTHRPRPARRNSLAPMPRSIPPSSERPMR